MTKSTGLRNAYELGREIVEEMRGNNGGICSFGVSTFDSDRLGYSYVGAPCHAQFAYDMLIGQPYGYIVDAMHKRGREITPHNAKSYIKWLFMKSPYRSIFAEKNIEKGWKRGFFIHRTDVDANLLASGCIAMRMLSEKPHIPFAWYKLVQAGADPDLAFLLAHGVTHNHTKGTISLKSSTCTGHVPVSPSSFSVEDVKRFLTGKFKQFGIFKETRTYYGIHRMWRHPNTGKGPKWQAERDVNMNFQSIIYDIWLNERTASLVKDKRVALFNHEFNRATNNVNIATEDEGYPILARILNNYRRNECQV